MSRVDSGFGYTWPALRVYIFTYYSISFFPIELHWHRWKGQMNTFFRIVGLNYLLCKNIFVIFQKKKNSIINKLDRSICVLRKHGITNYKFFFTKIQCEAKATNYMSILSRWNPNKIQPVFIPIWGDLWCHLFRPFSLDFQIVLAIISQQWWLPLKWSKPFKGKVKRMPF